MAACLKWNYSGCLVPLWDLTLKWNSVWMMMWRQTHLWMWQVEQVHCVVLSVSYFPSSLAEPSCRWSCELSAAWWDARRLRHQLALKTPVTKQRPRWQDGEESLETNSSLQPPSLLCAPACPSPPPPPLWNVSTTLTCLLSEHHFSISS